MSENFKTRLTEFLDAAYPVLGIETFEEDRAIRDIRDVATARLEKDKTFKHYEWDETLGLTRVRIVDEGEDAKAGSVEVLPAEFRNANNALAKVVALSEPTKSRSPQGALKYNPSILVMKDIHPHLEKSGLWRAMRNEIGKIKNYGVCVIFLCARLKVPAELSKNVQMLEYGLPSREAMEEHFPRYVDRNLPGVKVKNLPPGFIQSVAEASMGMTETEADNAFALASVNSSRRNDRKLVFDQDFVRTIFEVKITNLRNSALEYMPTHSGFESVGGLEGVKGWAIRRREGFDEKARVLHLPYPKGVLLAGIKGCIAGDARVDVTHNKKIYTMPMRDLYQRVNHQPCPVESIPSLKPNQWFHGKYIPKLNSLWTKDGEAFNDKMATHLHEIDEVIYQGIKPVVKIKFLQGGWLRLTPDHEVASAKGWCRADQLKAGDYLIARYGREQVEYVVEDGSADVYDIVMKDPYRNFLVSDVFVHNCGKSLTAMAIAHQFGFPLFKFDVTKLFAGKVGESEALTRDAIRTMESLGRCVIMLDEIEKFFSTDATSGGGDSGVSSRMFGTLVSWMSLKTCPVFIVGTLNNFDRLPPELTRKGRFDEVFFVDLPTPAEREAVFKALIKYKFKAAAFENCITPELIARTDEFSGAEIEAVIEEALYGLLGNPQAKGTDLLLGAAGSIKPQAKIEPELVARLRHNSTGFKQASLASEAYLALPAEGKRRINLN